QNSPQQARLTLQFTARIDDPFYCDWCPSRRPQTCLWRKCMPITRRSVFKTAFVFAVTTLTCFAQTAAPTLPAEISDKDFWRLIVDLSEPGGVYPYENFVSNELQYQDVVP